jgi:hypothetical protein
MLRAGVRARHGPTIRLLAPGSPAWRMAFVALIAVAALMAATGR